MEINDVAVIGGGPAGLAAAIALARGGARVTLFDARPAEHVLRRTETLQARLASVLRQIGADGAIRAADAIPAFEIASRWPGPRPHERSSMIDPQGPAFHVQRGAFRSALTEMAVAAGVSVFSGERVRAAAGHSNWRLVSAARDVEASFLIVATGRDALPIAAQVTRRRVDRLVAAVGRARSRGQSDTRLVVEATSHGWWYSCPLGANLQQIVFLSDADLVCTAAHTADNWFTRCAAGLEFARDLRVDDTVRIVAADTYCRGAVVGDNVIVIGDAAMAGDPLAGTGVTWAIKSGLRAAEIVLSPNKDPKAAMADYSDYVGNSFVRFLATRSATYDRVKRWPKSPFWERRKADHLRLMSLSSEQPAHRSFRG